MSDYYRQLNFYIDATVPEWYIESEDGAALLAANVKSISFGELVRASFQLTNGEPVFNSSGVLQNPWTAFAGSEAVSEVVIDNNFNWWDDCHLHTAITAGTAIATIEIDNLAAVPRALGSIRLSASDIVHYNAYTKQGNTYTFTLADESFDTASFTPAAGYAAGAAVRIIEMPVIVSAENAGIPATGYFAGTLDAANPVYEALIEGNSSISGTQLELSIFVSGRAVFRSRVIFDCLSALNPGEGTDYLRPNVWAAADSRYIQFANLSTTATALPAGSSPTATVTVTGEAVNIDFGIPEPEQLSGSYIEFSAVDASGNYTLAGTTTVPYAVLTNAGNFYPVEKGSVTVDTVNNTVTLDVTPYLAYDGAASFSGTWRLYFAAGSIQAGDAIETLTGTAITPQHGAVFRKTLAASDAFTISTASLTASKQVTFELHLVQPSTAVSFTLPNTLLWPDLEHFASGNTPPAMSTANTLYCIVIRWDGSDLLANLAYSKAVSA